MPASATCDPRVDTPIGERRLDAKFLGGPTFSISSISTLSEASGSFGVRVEGPCP